MKEEELNYSIFDEPAENLEEEAYSIFDDPEEFDMDAFLAKEFSTTAAKPEEAAEEIPVEPVAEMAEQETENLMDFESMFGIPEEPEPAALDEVEDLGFIMPDENESPDAFMAEELLPEAEIEDFILPQEEETDFVGLDGLLDGLDEEAVPEEPKNEQESLIDDELAGLLAASEVSEAKAKAERKAKKEKASVKDNRSLWQKLFGNVPVDPSTVKPEPTKEELAEKKKQAEEEKKKSSEEKKATKEEKKAAAQAAKEEKAKQKAIAKEEKKAKKMEAAKQILEDMQVTRINRLGATIVFVLFAAIAVGIFYYGGEFGYTASVESAEKSFGLALNNDIKHYNDAYEQIYGIDVKPEDQELYDKIMTVMFVNKELTSYQSLYKMEDYDAALHALIKGVQRHGKYRTVASDLGIDRDMDYVLGKILTELDTVYGITQDEAEVLRDLLIDASIDAEAQKNYNLELYEIVKESGLLVNEAEVTE